MRKVAEIDSAVRMTGKISGHPGRMMPLELKRFGLGEALSVCAMTLVGPWGSVENTSVHNKIDMQSMKKDSNDSVMAGMKEI